METLLKKAWESVSNRSISISEKMQGGAGAHASTGSFNRVPDEIFILILKSLGPKEAAKLAVVCKTWRTIVSDNRLWMYFFQSNEQDSWDSIFFAEAHLRFGYPLQKFCNQTPQLSYKRIYGQRAQVPVSVIIDGGSGYCKFGWSKDRCPSGRSATFLEFGNIESPMYSRLRHFFATIYSRMQAKPTNQPIVVVTPICHYDDTESDKASRRQLKEAIYSALFDLNVPAVCAINQATLALYAARQASGIVVNIGFQQTSVVPILHGKVMCNVGVEIVGMGASKLTGFLREQMQQMNIHFESLYTIRELKEKLCYVALDYEAELSKDTQASYKVSREGTFTLSKERFQAGEILFQPRIAGVRAMGLHQAVALCIDHCHDAELMCDDSWFKTVVLSGGTACLPGLPGRLEKELHELLPPSMASGIRVIPPPFGVDSAWFGAKAISNLSTFPGTWCVTKKQFKYKFRKNLIGPW
ncbi:hypothetical protein Nepgr_026242 [Nepenthes gracilis]|uniref:F-box domain-containing protein n=1 Tax=Nepenthes gracilis TaxID=150966 RepID=A0AAD3T7Z4_NEPGR|nr:hypothetical protein Nepgr_026242 [Nepenthes gracilis]